LKRNDAETSVNRPAAGSRAIDRHPFPHLLQPLARHRHRRAQFLREQLHAQFLEQPAELFELRVGHALAASTLARRS
jgi:hypothetical protein